MKLRLRILTDDDIIAAPTLAHTVMLATRNDGVRYALLEFYGEVPKAEDEDGPTVSAWQPVEVV